MKILYACDFYISKELNGKNRATAQKLKALGELCELTIVCAQRQSRLLRAFEIVRIELRCVHVLFKTRPDFFISRGYVGFISCFISKLLAVQTVREVHADVLGEIPLLRFNGLTRKIVSFASIISDLLNRMSDIRIFNHPYLMRWYQEKVCSQKKNDFFSYNGFDPDAVSHLSKYEARSRMSIDQDATCLVFVGGASEWHGVEYLISLQKEFIHAGDDIQIIVGGGDISSYDPAELCRNITPLDSDGCAKLIRAADLCLLPVKQNRVSPGSPLKLYDYIANGRFVAAQKGVSGYDDEVITHKVGLSLDFTDSASARSAIIDYLALNRFDYDGSVVPVSWADRMRVWLENLNRALSSPSRL